MPRQLPGDDRLIPTAASPFTRCSMALCFGAAFLLVLMQRQDGLLSFKIPERSPLLETAIISTPTEPTELQSEDAAAPASVSPVLPVPAHSPEIVVNLGDRKLDLYRDGERVASYTIAVGQAEWPTPTGRFQVQQMQENPLWKHPITQEIVPAGPNNPLGTRWIGFWSDGTGQIGIHGTNQTDLLGQAVSHGCIRMRDEEIQELYNQIQIGTVVIIQSE